MKKYILGALFLAGITAFAQDLTTIQSVSSEDLNGTARYVGMGGAMSALGADISTMSTNPAGIGLYRKNDVAFTASVLWQPSNERVPMNDRDRAHASFDQIGTVLTLPMSGKMRSLNFGFNYHKLRNFQDFVCTGDVATGGLSQTMQLEDLAHTDVGGYGVIDLGYDGNPWGQSWALPISNLAYQNLALDPYDDVNLKNTYLDPYTNRYRHYAVSPAKSYRYNRLQWGDTRAFDFNLACNIKDRVYLGLNIGYYSMRLNSLLSYNEQSSGLYPTSNKVEQAKGPYSTYNDQYAEGDGVDFKLGVIVRPMEESPFRVGFAITTPRYMSVTSDSRLSMSNGKHMDTGKTVSGYVQIDPFRYRIRTPWKLNLSLGTTVSDWLALDAEYEMNNCSSAGIYYDLDGGYTYNTSKDLYWKNEVKSNMKTQHTLRVGAEARFAQHFYGRIGYNYVTSCYKDDARLYLTPYAGDEDGYSYNDGTYSESYYQQTTTDLVRYGDMHRVTLGLGYHGKHFYTDLAYLCQMQNASVVPFDLSDYGVKVPEADLKLHRHQIMLTLGTKF